MTDFIPCVPLFKNKKRKLNKMLYGRFGTSFRHIWLSGRDIRE